MEEIKSLKERNIDLCDMGNSQKDNAIIKEKIFMKHILRKIYKKNFKLLQCLIAYEEGWSFSNSSQFFKDGRNIY